MKNERVQRHYAQMRAQGGRQIAKFAECMAEGYTIAAAARAIGVVPQRGSQYFARMRAELGHQAI